MARISNAKLLARYIERQPEARWGSEYQPAIQATPQEAPRVSRPTILYSALLGREVHLLSTPEFQAALLALHNPNLIDLHEQKLLSCVPDTHPLFKHPLAAGLALPAVQGTLKVAQRLGTLTKHPKFFTADQGGAWVPLPYVGDLLLFLQDEDGPYAINWTIKLTPEDFYRRGPQEFGKVRRREPDPGADWRHQLEEEYYADAGIRTVRVTGSQLNPTLIANLRDLFGWHRRAIDVDTEKKLQIFSALKERIGSESAAIEVVRNIARRVSVEEYQVKTLLYQFIWNRQLRVDLYRPLLMNRPLCKEVMDPMFLHDDWFRR